MIEIGLNSEDELKEKYEALMRDLDIVGDYIKFKEVTD